MKNTEKRVNKSYVFEIIKAVIIALIISLVLILIMALCIKLFNIPTNIIPVINQIIKGLSILIGCLISLKLPNNGWLRGIIVGIFYIALSFVVFSLLDGAFKFGLNILTDVAIGSVTGMISGIIAGFTKSMKKSA